MLFDAWRGLSPDAGVPSLRDFLTSPDPILQPHMTILDVVDAATLRVRLIGTRLVELAGADLTGSNLFDFVRDPAMAKQLRHASDVVVNQPCGLWSMKRAITMSGHQISIEMLSLPFRPFAGGAPIIAAAVDVTERLHLRDTVFGLVAYLGAEWIDLGHGVPKRQLAESRSE